MKLRRHRSVGLAALSSALVLFSGNVDAARSELTVSCNPDAIADGNCDSSLNMEACAYDGGDCCECTCISTDDNMCGNNSGFACIDPGASCVEDGDFTSSLENDSTTDEEISTTSQCLIGFISDGDCDPSNNNEACGYDGGDCCECTCVSTEDHTCGDDTHGGFSCVDPIAACVEDNDDITLLGSGDSFLTADAWCWPEHLSDGDCDPVNNKADCGYDGGDCCECTCVSTTEYACGDDKHGGFMCVDPSASCVDDDDITTFYTDEYSDDIYLTSTYECMKGHLSNGNCDPINNREDCGYDGGDCCECTCVSSSDYTCGDAKHGGFTCLDPQCVDGQDDITTTESDDHSGTDGDDMTTLASDDHSGTNGDDVTIPESDDGLDTGDTTLPEADPNTDEGSTTDATCLPEYYSDGDCDLGNNNEDCGYDGGDCCECTCASTTDVTCGDSGYDCVDPSSSCDENDVEAGTKTTITASANGYDTRAGEDSGDVGCGEDGCSPALTRDGITDDDAESRWSCMQKLVSDGTACAIEFEFEDLQDIMEVQVSFYKGDQRSRTVRASVNGEVVGEFDSDSGSTYSTFDIQSVGVGTMTFSAVGLTENDWISFTEVRFMVEA